MIFVSDCEKRAIKRTRAVLDSYAVRTGAATWATPITMEALSEVRAALKRTATRQTAVACYTNDGRRRMRLAWVVGSRSSFGETGHFKAGSKKMNASNERIPSAIPEWVRVASMLARASGLVHDIGKASQKFQDKLRSASVTQSDDIRHEWISMRVLQEMRGNGHQWAQAWSSVAKREEREVQLGDRKLDRRNAVQSVSDVLEAIDFLVVTHHGLLRAQGDKPLSTPAPSLPTPQGRHVRQWPAQATQLTPQGQVSTEILDAYWRLESKLVDRCAPQKDQDTLYWRALTLIARAALIFSDHVISAQRVSQEEITSGADGLFANTRSGSAQGQRELNQSLDWHLQAVGDLAEKSMVRFAQLAGFASAGSNHGELPCLSPRAVENICRASEPEGRFAWQNAAADALALYREKDATSPVLVFNMAGTGAGKTRMNLRAACSLNPDRGTRVAIALNLRSLTLQTGAALRSSMELDSNELAVVIGDSTAQHLFDFESRASRFADDDENTLEPEFDTEGGEFDLPDWLNPLFQSTREKAVLGAPLLVSTIDFLIAAGQPGSQGHHVKALGRIMSSDLVLDEIDSYEPEPLVAVLRLVQLAALFGRNVICSSATLAMPVALAVERAYRSGIKLRSRLNGIDSFGIALIDDQLPPLVVACSSTADTAGSFEGTYATRLLDISNLLESRPAYRVAELLRLDGPPTVDSWTQAVVAGIERLHQAHCWNAAVRSQDLADPTKRVSFGLVRVANIGTAIDTARAIATALPNAQVACYHSGHFLIARFHIERWLDRLLFRGRGNDHIAANPEIQDLLIASNSEDIPFVVVATPVEEIGRDHDFDWSIIDVSSAQSIVQTAGRTNRHRLKVVGSSANILIPQFNWRHCKNAERGNDKNSAFVWPGYEAKSNVNPLRSSGEYADHDLEHLLPWKEGQLRIDARLRFDSERCALAKADDTAIQKRIGPFFGIDGAFCKDTVHTWTITDGLCGPYFPTALRGGSGDEIELRVSGEEPNLVFEQLKVIPRFGRLDRTWMRESIGREHPAMPNAWLAAPPALMSQICEEATLDPRKAMIVTLKGYGGQTVDPKQWCYDLGFGIYKL